MRERNRATNPEESALPCRCAEQFIFWTSSVFPAFRARGGCFCRGFLSLSFSLRFPRTSCFERQRPTTYSSLSLTTGHLHRRSMAHPGCLNNPSRELHERPPLSIPSARHLSIPGRSRGRAFSRDSVITSSSNSSSFSTLDRSTAPLFLSPFLPLLRRDSRAKTPFVRRAPSLFRCIIISNMRRVFCPTAAIKLQFGRPGFRHRSSLFLSLSDFELLTTKWKRPGPRGGGGTICERLGRIASMKLSHRWNYSAFSKLIKTELIIRRQVARSKLIPYKRQLPPAMFERPSPDSSSRNGCSTQPIVPLPLPFSVKSKSIRTRRKLWDSYRPYRCEHAALQLTVIYHLADRFTDKRAWKSVIDLHRSWKPRRFLSK